MRHHLLWVLAMTMLETFGSAGVVHGQHYDFQDKTLANGLRVVTLEDFSCPVVAVNVWYHVGAVNEDPNRQGFAHMFEHMMFRGSDRLGPKDHFELISRSGGDCNAYTSFDQTVYTNRVPANQLPLVLWLEAERMALLKIDAEGYATERKVVEEERRMGLNRPYGAVFEKMLPEVFVNHPYRWTPIGQIPHLRAASVEEVRAFWRKYYVPNNATLVIVGAIKHADAQKLAEQYLGWIPRRPQPPTVADAKDQPPGPRQVVVAEPRGPVPMVGLVFRTVPVAHPDRAALNYLAQVLGDGHSSRLYRDLVRKQKLAVDVDASPMALEHGGLLYLRATLQPGGDTRKALAELQRHVDTIIAEPITEAEWTKARNQLLRAEVTGATTVSGKAGLLGKYAVIIGDLGRVNKQLDEIRAVTPADVQRVAKTYLTPDRTTTLLVEPRKDATAAPDEAAEPSVGPAPTTGPDSPPTITRPADFPKDPPIKPVLDKMPAIVHQDKVLANGLKVVVVPDHRVPFIRLTLDLKFGAWTEDPDRAGAALMAAHMITRGTANYTAEQLAEELELHAISLDGNAGLDTASVQADCLTEHLDLAAKLLAEVALHPTFPQSEFDLLKSQTLNELMIKAQTPTYLADSEFRTRLFGSHPYSRRPTGEPADVNKLTVPDLTAWWTKFVRPDAAVLYVAGDIQPDAAFALAERTFAQWQAAGPLPQPKLADLPAAGPTHIYLVDKPGLVQSEIRVGHLGITRDNPEYFVTRVVSHFFGGAFNSRLNRSIRIEKGLTYGVGGGFIADRFAGTFSVRTFTKTPRTAETVAALLDQLAALRSADPTADEIAGSQSYIVGSFAGNRETPQSIVNDLWLVESTGLPADFLDQFLAGVRQTNPAAALRAAKALVHPDKLTIVVVGDAAAVKAGLEKIAPVTVVEKSATTRPQ